MLPATMVAGSFFFAGILFGADAPAVSVTVHNNLAIARLSETVELTATQLAALGDLTKVHVFEKASGREILAQSLDLDGDLKAESLVFQADLPPNGEQAFELRAGGKRVYKKEDFRVYGRFVRERFDDFAWENDRIAHRMYGAALEKWEHEPLTSSTVDVWLKRTRRLVVNDWYMVDDYHHNHGEGGDFYSAGSSRGCGGNGLWRDGHLVVSKNFRDSRVLANGPIRLVFELVYPVWDAPGIRSEVKRITLDAGQNLSRFESRYDVASAADLTIAVGIKEFKGAKFRVEREAGWFRAWDVVKGAAGEYGCAVVFAQPSSVVDVAQADGNQMMIARAAAGGRIEYFAGAGWTQSGDFPAMADWDRYVEQWAQRIKSPLRVEVSIR